MGALQERASQPNETDVYDSESHLKELCCQGKQNRHIHSQANQRLW